MLLSLVTIFLVFPFSYQDYSGRIIGGTNINIAVVPSQVSIAYFGFHLCGGSILTTKYILTAAHCTTGRIPAFAMILAGSNYQNIGILSLVTEITNHPNFDSESMDYDVSILTLLTSLTYSAVIQPVVLPSGTTTWPIGTQGTVIGWATKSILMYPLQSINVSTIATGICNSIYSDSNITSTMFCASSTGTAGSCEGDSGGPLLINGVIAGIISWGNSCTNQTYPAVYTSVPSIRQFITSVAGV